MNWSDQVWVLCQNINGISSTAISSHVDEVQVGVHGLYARQPGVCDVQMQAAQYAAPPAVRARRRKFCCRNSQIVAAHDWNMFLKWLEIL